MSQTLSRLDSVTKVFQSGQEQVAAVVDASIDVSPGESVGIVGPSGSGKTTLLSLMGALLPPTRGEVLFQGKSVGRLGPAGRRTLRLRHVGFVFQQLRLVRVLSAVENVQLPMTLASAPRADARAKALRLLEDVGLSGKEGRRPPQLSVGEQQRVAVARALANDPSLILADEPTSQLDSVSGLKVVELLLSLKAKLGAALVVSTHDPQVAENLDRVYAMRDGVLTKPRDA
jgi:putative ABC transport system ATP-binding protein